MLNFVVVARIGAFHYQHKSKWADVGPFEQIKQP